MQRTTDMHVYLHIHRCVSAYSHTVYNSNTSTGWCYLCLRTKLGKFEWGSIRALGGRFVVWVSWWCQLCELKKVHEEKGCKERAREPALVPFKVCYLFKAVQTFTERWQSWNAEAGPRPRAAAVGNRCSPQPLQARSPSGWVSTQTVPEMCGSDSDRSRQRLHTHTHMRTHPHRHTHTHTNTHTCRYSRHTAGLIASLADWHTLTDRSRSHSPTHTRTHTHLIVHSHTHLLVHTLYSLKYCESITEEFCISQLFLVKLLMQKIYLIPAVLFKWCCGCPDNTNWFK